MTEQVKPVRDVRTVEWYEYLPPRYQKFEQPLKPLDETYNTRSPNFDPSIYMAKYAV